MIEKLIGNGANVNVTDSNFFANGTALHVAAIKGNAEIAEILIKNGIDINQKDKFGRVAFHYSCYYGKILTSHRCIDSTEFGPMDFFCCDYEFYLYIRLIQFYFYTNGFRTWKSN